MNGVSPLKHIWAAHITTSDPSTELAWTGSETGEALVSIDETAEAGFEQYVRESILQGDLEYRGEIHRKATKQGILLLIDLFFRRPGTLLGELTSWVWNTKTSVTTATGDTAHITQYYFSVPVSALAENGEDVVAQETSIDYRGLYIDWFHGDNEFYAAGGIYPESEAHLNNRLSDAFDEGILDLEPDIQVDTGGGYEREMIEMLQRIQ